MLRSRMRAATPVIVLRSLAFNALFYLVLLAYLLVALPTLLIEGRRLTEVAGILFYLARRFPAAGTGRCPS